MDADLRAHLLIIEKQLVASRCTIETALTLIAGALDTPPAQESAAEQALPGEVPSATPSVPEGVSQHRVFGGGAARIAVPILTPDDSGVLHRAP